MNKSQSKYTNTSKKMECAMVSLLEYKEFSEITVVDICKKAGVNRSTFYAHYDNTAELFEDTHKNLINNFLDECSYDLKLDFKNIGSIDKDDLNFISPKYLMPYLQYIKKHKRLCKIYADNSHTFRTDDIDDYLIINMCMPIYKRYGVSDARIINYMQRYFLKGIDAIVTEWLRHDCQDDVAFICDVIMYSVRPMTYKNDLKKI
ncbi:MAG: TetR/AcrR family transcriptional regulator [Christensenellales bacterium]